MKLALAAVLALGALACSTPAGADKFSDGDQLAADDLASVVAHAQLAGTFAIGRLYWSARDKHTVGEARVLLPADASDALADAPYLVADSIALDLGPPAHIVTPPDPAKLRATAARVPDATAALALARSTLKQQPRYATWQHERWRYATAVTFYNGHVLVWFDPPDVTDNDIYIEIDPVANKVISVRLGMA